MTIINPGRAARRALAAVAAAIVPFWAYSTLAGWDVAAGCVLGWVLLAASVVDVRRKIVPDLCTLPLIAIGIGVTWLDGSPLTEHLVGAVVGFLSFVLVNLAYRAARGRDGLGLGDAKLLAAAGAWIGWQGLPSVVFLASFLALTWVLAGRLGGTRFAADTVLPFGPFLALGVWIVWLYGPVGFPG